MAIAAEIAQLTGHPFQTALNKFAAQGGLDAMPTFPVRSWLPVTARALNH